MSTDSAEAKCLLPDPEMTRRGFAMTTLATGFALASLPVSAQTIVTTPADGLMVGEITVRVKDGTIPAYHAMPNTKGPFPIVLVVQEIFGVHEHVKDICRRFAQQGYLAIAPELYARQGNPAAIKDVQQLMKEIVSKVPDLQVMADLDATVAWAKENGGDTNRLGITGFCWGGRVTWLYASHNPSLKAGVAWYGRLTTPANPLQDMVPIERVKELKAPVLGLYGEADKGIPVADVEKMREALKAAGKTDSEIVLYPGAPHAFFADYRPSYTPDAAADGWKRCLAWFKRHGVA
ncbi:dienelactone hydrolase family protein [Aerophototrophica crusticola]|uniref:Dienelactone hydrolase family protein n=1 Tax=Aerophototrophica crusticola TaxID=1709002 RepID=A0A858R7W8_9PROT|nr:dienelactone hydrolase family protein [Rhodospirillaceae bacterium B3]